MYFGLFVGCRTSVPERTKPLVFLSVLAHEQAITSIVKVWPPSTATAATATGVSMPMGLIGSTELTLSAKTLWQVWPLTQFSTLFSFLVAKKSLSCLESNSVPT